MFALLFYLPGLKRSEALSWVLIFGSLVLDFIAGGLSMTLFGLKQAAVYGSLMIAISFVQPAARASVVAESLAAHITKKGVTSGSWQAHALAHAAGATLNLSGLVIMLSAAHRSALNFSGRASTAVFFQRGFAPAPVWSPYSYFTPLMLAAFPMLTWPTLLVLGAIIAGPLLLVSLRSPPLIFQEQGNLDSSPVTYSQVNTHRGAALRWICFTAFFASIVGLLTFGEFGSLTVIVLALPLLAIAWGALEAWVLRNVPAFLSGIWNHINRQVPLLRSEVLALAAAGLASDTLHHWHLNDILLPSISHLNIFVEVAQSLAIFLTIVFATSFGINPILFVIPLSGAIAASASSPISAPVAIVIIACAWALFPTISSFAAATLLTSRETGIDARALVSKVNASYNRRALIYCAFLVASTVVATRLT